MKIHKIIRFKTLVIDCFILVKRRTATIQIFLERGDNSHHLFDFNLEKWCNSGDNIIWFNFCNKWLINAPT